MDKSFTMPDAFDIPNESSISKKNNNYLMKFTKNHIIFLVIAIFLLASIFFFAYRFIAPFGAKITYQFNPKDSDKVSKLVGADSSENIDNKAVSTLVIPQQMIRQNIVTFNLKLLSQKIDGVWVNLKFKGAPKELKIGVKGSLKEAYTYKPLYENILEGLKDFENIDNKLIFWQKEKKYEDFNHFVENPPVDKLTGIYFFDSTGISELQSKNAPSTKTNKVVINKAFRGSHSLFVKVDNNELNLTIEKQDRNDYKGPDIFLIELYKGNKKIFTKEIPDDGMEEVSGLKLASQKETINLKGIERGIYRVNLIDKSNGADINIKSVNVNQQKIVFSPQIFIVDENPTKLWTNLNSITLLTLHPGSLQTVRIDKKTDLEIKEVEKEYSFNLSENKNSSSSSTLSKIHLLEMPKNDLIIKGNGFFSFSEDAFFDPNIINSTDLTKVIDVNDIDYIIASYQKVKKDGEWKVAQIHFDPKDIKIDGDKLYFSLESPELANYGGEIAIDNLEVTVNKPGWFGGNEQKTDNDKQANNEQKMGEKGLVGNIWGSVTGFFGNTWNNTVNFFSNLWPFGEKEEKKTEVTPTPKKPTPTVTPTPKAEKISIQVLNGGGEPGAAGKFAQTLKNAGFIDVEASNSDIKYKNAIIKYKKDGLAQEKVLEKITELLKKNYASVTENVTATKSGLITIILGEKPASASPTIVPKVTISPTTTVAPTKKL